MKPKERAIEIYHTCLNIGSGYISDYLAGEYAKYVIVELQESSNNDYYKKVQKALKQVLKHK